MADLGHGRGWLTDAAARSIARIDRAIGHPLQITEAGRSFARQDEHYQAYLRYLAGGPWAPIALSPKAPSIHQLGNAIDSDEAQKFVVLMNEHGWIRTVYRNGKLVEPWHFEYATSRDRHINDPEPQPEAEPEVDPMPAPIINVVPKNGDDPDKMGTIWIGNMTTGEFEKYTPPYDPNVREVLAVAFFGGQKMPTLNARDFQTVQRFWRTIAGGK